MSAARGMLSVGMVVTIVVMIGVWLSVESRAQAPDKPSIAGGWTLNRDLSDHPADRADDRGDDDRGRRDGGHGRGGGFGRGGGGVGRGGGYGRGGGMPANPEEMARVRDAIRDIMNPPDHLVITDTGSMIVVTGPGGRTTRLSPDNRKVKDENTKIERKTRWDEGRLVSEISGGRGKMIETYAIDHDLHQLRLTVQMEGDRSGRARTLTYVYDADAR